MPKKSVVVPLERHEQAAFVDWLELQGLLFSATAQSTYTKSWNQKRLNHATGLRKGVPDLIIFVPEGKSKDGECYILFVEMKRKKGGVVSPEQKIWLDCLNSVDSWHVSAYVARGADEAIKIVSHYLKAVYNSAF